MLADLDQYLAAIGEAPGASIVDQEENLDTVVRAVVANDPSDLAAALSALRQGVGYHDLAEAPEDAYKDLAAAGAFALVARECEPRRQRRRRDRLVSRDPP